MQDTDRLPPESCRSWIKPSGRELRRSSERSRRRAEKKIQQLIKVRKGFMN